MDEDDSRLSDFVTIERFLLSPMLDRWVSTMLSSNDGNLVVTLRALPDCTYEYMFRHCSTNVVHYNLFSTALVDCSAAAAMAPRVVWSCPENLHELVVTTGIFKNASDLTPFLPNCLYSCSPDQPWIDSICLLENATPTITYADGTTTDLAAGNTLLLFQMTVSADNPNDRESYQNFVAQMVRKYRIAHVQTVLVMPSDKRPSSSTIRDYSPSTRVGDVVPSVVLFSVEARTRLLTFSLEYNHDQL
jgi:hypothetical protein